MGCAKPSIHEKAIEFELDKNQAAELDAIMKYLGLSWSEVDRIHASFNMIDLDCTRTIDKEELLESIGAHNSRYAQEAFRVFDRNHDGDLDFVEFLVASTKLCCADHENLCRFAFRVVDQDGSGEVDRAELATIVNYIYGETVRENIPGSTLTIAKKRKTHEKKNTAAVILDNLDYDHSGALSIEEFIHAAHRFPQLIEPAFNLQRQLRSKVVNNHFWVKRQDRIRKRFREVVHHKKEKHEKKAKVRDYVKRFSDPRVFQDGLKGSSPTNRRPSIKVVHGVPVEIDHTGEGSLAHALEKKSKSEEEVKTPEGKREGRRESGEHASEVRKSGDHSDIRKSGDHKDVRKSGDHNNIRNSGDHKDIRNSGDHRRPSDEHHRRGSVVPTDEHHRRPSAVPTAADGHHRRSSAVPTDEHHRRPSAVPTDEHHRRPSAVPTDGHHRRPSAVPTDGHHRRPSAVPTATDGHHRRPSAVPTAETDHKPSADKDYLKTAARASLLVGKTKNKQMAQKAVEAHNRGNTEQASSGSRFKVISAAGATIGSKEDRKSGEKVVLPPITPSPTATPNSHKQGFDK